MNRISHSLIDKNYVFEKQINSKVSLVKSKDQWFIKKVYDYSEEQYLILKLIQTENLKNCIKIHIIELHKDFGKLIVLEEYCEAGSLQSIIEQTENFQIDQIIKCLIDIIKGIQQLSKYSYMHRDIKPQNIVFNGKHFKIIDFETSKNYGQNLKKYQSHVGTRVCQAPEILLNDTYSSKCDIWSIGCVLYYMLFKQYPIKFYDRESIYKFYQADQIQFPTKINSKLQELLKLMLKTKEKDRPSLTALYFQVKLVKIQIKFNVNYPDQSLQFVIDRMKLIFLLEKDEQICQNLYQCIREVLRQKVNSVIKDNNKKISEKTVVLEIISDFKSQKIYLDLMNYFQEQLQE